MFLIASLVSAAGTSAATAAPDATAADRRAAALDRAGRAVERNCPHLAYRLVKLFGIMAETAGVGLIAVLEAPGALLDYLVTEPKTTTDNAHPYFPRTDEYSRDISLRYRALVEGIDTPACLRAVCNVERLQRRDGQALSPACEGSDVEVYHRRPSGPAGAP